MTKTQIEKVLDRIESDLADDRKRFSDQFIEVKGEIVKLKDTIQEINKSLGRFKDQAKDGVTDGVAQAAKPLSDLADKLQETADHIGKKLKLPANKKPWYLFWKKVK